MIRSCLLVSGVGVVSRLLVWLLHGRETFAGFKIDATWLSDCRGALSDPLFLLVWDHARPPLFALREVAKCAAADFVAPWHVNLLLVSAADIFAAVLLFAVLRRLSVRAPVAVAIAATWSVGLIAWEYYRYGNSHNHLNVALFALLVWTGVRRWHQPGAPRDLGFALAGALSVAASGVALMIVPLLAVATVPLRLSKRRIAAGLLIALSLPGAAYVAIAYKNQTQFGVFSTSGFLPVNMGQFAFISLGYDNPGEKLVALTPKLGGSQWWHWCFDRRVNDKSKPHPYLVGLQGQCIDFSSPGDIKTGLDAARRLRDDLFERSLVRDLKTAEKAPWAMRFPRLGMNSATEVTFNDTSKRLYMVMLRDDPIAMLRTFLMANRSFFVWGPLMFDGIHYEPHLVLAPAYINWIATGLGLFMLFGAVGGLVLAVVVFCRRTAAWQRGGAWFGDMDDEALTDLLTTGIILAFLIAGTVMNGVSCCENGRQFQSMAVLPFLAGVLVARKLVRRLVMNGG